MPQPAFAVRGFMLDVSRDRVPRPETLDLLVDLLAACGYNQLELYMEHTFAHAGQQEVWRHASPLDADEMRRLDRRCASRGIALVANRNSLGHMERWLQHDEHRHRAENPDGFWMWDRHWPASTLAITPENLDLVAGLVAELVATTTAPAVNIGMDEPWEFGQGASRELVNRQGAGAVYTDWVLAVAQPWLERGYRVEMWGDILAHHPEQAERLPDGLALVLWCYDSPDYLRTCGARAGVPVGEAPGFGDAVRPFARRGSSLWVAPGTGVWNSVAGRLDCAVPNILDAAHVGSEVGAGGLLLTSWGDNGNWEGPLHWLVPVVVGGLAAQDPAAADELLHRDALVARVGQVLFDDAEHAGAELLVRLGYLTSLLATPVENSTLFFHQFFDHVFATAEPPAGALDEVRREVVALRALAAELAGPGWVAEVGTVLTLVETSLRRMAGEAAPVPEEVVDQVRRNWLGSSRPGGLDDSIAKANGLAGPGRNPDRVDVAGYWTGILGR